ncbi:hypothetical protein IKE96_02435 [bacterium]|nr:hypothetical protein [bacterium]
MKKILMVIVFCFAFMLFNSNAIAKEKMVNNNEKTTYKQNVKYLNLESNKVSDTSVILTNSNSIDWVSLIGKGLNFLIKVAKKLGVALKYILQILSGINIDGGTTTSLSTVTNVTTNSTTASWYNPFEPDTTAKTKSTTTTTTSSSSDCPSGFGVYTIGGFLGIGGEKYCMVYNYDAPKVYNMEQQKDYGDGCCNCYASAYYRKINGENVSDEYWNKPSGCNCVKTGLPTDNNINTTFNAIINNNKPAIAKLKRKVNDEYRQHYVLFVGVKKSAIGNSSHDLSDFLILDTYDKSIYNGGARIPYYSGTYNWIWSNSQHE